MGWCVDAPTEPVVVPIAVEPKRTYTRRVVEAEVSVPAKRTYKRRDLTAD
jgi:hypothetical protein